MDGQAQLDVGGEAANNSRAQSARENFGPGKLFSSQVALSLHFSFKLGVTITLLPYLARNLKFDKILRKHLGFFVLQPML